MNNNNFKYFNTFHVLITHPVDFVDHASGILLQANEWGEKVFSPSLRSREGLG